LPDRDRISASLRSIPRFRIAVLPHKPARQAGEILLSGCGMSLDLSLLVFTFVMTLTPGPNTMMLLASGVNFGFRATVPHMAGITLGFGVMTLVVGMGLGEIFKLYPQLYAALACRGSLMFLAWRIATTQSVDEGRAGSKPFTFLQAAVAMTRASTRRPARRDTAR
jgi:hypothetical protein